MANKLPTALILSVLIAGCGCPARPDAEGSRQGADASVPGAQQTDPPDRQDPGDAKGPSNVRKPVGDAKGGEGRSSGPAAKPDDAGKPAGNPKPLEAPPDPTYGLPLEIELEVPEVPEKLRGPTPPDQLKPKK